MPPNRLPTGRWIYPLVLGELWLFSLLSIAINVHFQVLAVRAGHGSQGYLTFLIAMCSITFVSASVQIVCTTLHLAGAMMPWVWDRVSSYCAVLDLMSSWGIMFGIIVSSSKDEVRLVGGCLPDSSRPPDALCVEWTFRLIFTLLLAFNLTFDLWICQYSGFRKDCDRIDLTNWRQDLFGWIPWVGRRRSDIRQRPRIHIPQRPWFRSKQMATQNIPPPPGQPMQVVYNTPAAGPNARIDLEQAVQPTMG